MKKSNSASFLPNILPKNILIKKRNKPSNKIFMTISDDLKIASHQIEQIDDILKKDTVDIRKLWQKKLTNNIYKSSGKPNYQILKEFTQRYRINKENNLSKFDWSKQRYLNNKQVSLILDGNKISKRILEKMEINQKIGDKKVNIKAFIFNTRDIAFKNIRKKLINEERKTILMKEKEYEQALEYEKKSLEKDIDNFDIYKLDVKQRMKDDELTLNQLIQRNKFLYEESKRLSYEYKYIVEEIIRYIKLIINYKTYASFVHTLLDEDTKILDINLNQYINYKNWSEKDLKIYIKKVLEEMDLYLKEILLNEKTLDILSDNNRLEILFEIMEQNILKVFEEKEKLKQEQKRMNEENSKKYEKLKNDYENNKAKYNIYMTELEEEKAKLNKSNIDPELLKYYNDIINLLDNFCRFIRNDEKETKKNQGLLDITNKNEEEDSYFYFEKDVKNCFRALKEKQFYVLDLINEIEGYNKEDPELLKIIIGERRLTNKMKRRENEKAKIKANELSKKEMIIKKFGQNIIRQRFKLEEQIPLYILKERRKHIIKYKPESTSTNLLFY